MAIKGVRFSAKETRKEIESAGESIMQFGVSFLDDAFVGIKNSDLIIIAGDSGHGKTELVAQIACSNAKKGKKVYYFALEAYKREIEKRLAYKSAATKYFNEPDRCHFNVSFPLYEANQIDKRFLPYALHGEAEVEKLYRENLIICHRDSKGYNVNDFESDFVKLDALADLIIVDHINYFDELDKMNEYKNLSYAAKKINEMVNLYNVPVIVVSHIRKWEHKSERIIPDRHDIHGSSNVPKEATKVIIIGKDYSKEDDEEQKYIFSTFLRVAKFRGMGFLEKYAGAIDYDIRTNQYGKNYTVAKLIKNDKKIKYLQGVNKPFWAKRGI